MRLFLIMIEHKLSLRRGRFSILRTGLTLARVDLSSSLVLLDRIVDLLVLLLV